MHQAIENYFLSGAPLRVTYPLMQQIRLAMPDVLKIWESSPMCQKSRENVRLSGIVEETCRNGLENGSLTLDSEYVPEGLIEHLPRRV